MSIHNKFEKAFSTLKKHEIGMIEINSGQIIISDAFGVFQSSPFKANFPIGHFPVELALIESGENNLEYIALSSIKFSDEDITEWQVAKINTGSTLSNLFFNNSGIAVDSGTVAVLDMNCKEDFKNEAMQNNGFDYIVDRLSSKPSNGWISDELKYDNGNIFMFTSGVGDGSYQAYIGFGKNKEICRLVIDFELIE